MVQVEGRLRRDVEQRARLEAALHVHAHVLERVVPVVADVLVELAVLVLGDRVPLAGPDRLHRVERLALQANGIRHEVGVALDDVLEHPRLRVVVEPVLLVLRLEVEGDGGPGRRALGPLERVAAVAGRLPAGGLLRARAPGDDRDAVGDHEARVEADPELPDQLRGGRRLGLADGPQELAGARARDGAEVLDHLRPAHADAVVVHRQGAGRGVDLQGDLELARGQLRAAQRLEADLVERVGGVGDQLAQEDVLVRVQRVDHEVQQLADLGLELVALGRLGHRGPDPRGVCSARKSVTRFRAEVRAGSVFHSRTSSHVGSSQRTTRCPRSRRSRARTGSARARPGPRGSPRDDP